MWEGAAHTVFTAQTQVDKGVLEELLRSLNHLIGCLEYAHSEYNKCREDVNDKIASIRLSGDT